MEHIRNRRRTFEIPLPSKPPDYRPGDGPPLAPICMSLNNDAGAFIVDKRVLPGKPIDGELKLELYYVVGWPDLPAARVAILATKILDYVSPWVLEDWEYRASLERDREKEREDAARKRKATERGEMRMASTSASGLSLPSTPGAQKKRGRPSKAEMVRRQIAQQASFGDEELANVHLPPASTSGPSLSTPQKRLARLATDVGELEKTDITKASRKESDVLESESDSEGDEGDEPEEPDHGLGFSSLNSFLPVPSSRGYAQFPVSNPPSSAQEDSAIPMPPLSSLSDSSSGGLSPWTKSQLTTPVPAPSYPKVRRKERVQLRNITSIPTPIPPPTLPRTHQPKPKSNPSTILPPRRVSVVPTPQIPQRKGTHTPVPPRPLPYSEPRPKAPKVTPVPVPTQPTQPRVTPVPVPVHPLFHGSNKKPRSAAYTPILPPALSHISTPIGGPGKLPSANANSSSRGTTSKKRKRPEPEEEDGRAWEVKWLEDDQSVEIDGQLYRYFRVRWEGDWPPDQNPTWEPEENIPEVLVRGYLKNRRRARAKMLKDIKPPKQVKKLQPTPPTRKYSNVAEAFEGDIKEGDQPLPSSGNPVSGQAKEEIGDEEESFRVTEQESGTGSRTGSGSRTDTPTHRLRLDPALIRELASRFTTHF